MSGTERIVLEIMWCNSVVTVVFTASRLSGGMYYSCSGWDDDNLTLRNWDERLNLLFDSEISYKKKLKAFNRRSTKK